MSTYEYYFSLASGMYGECKCGLFDKLSDGLNKRLDNELRDGIIAAFWPGLGREVNRHVYAGFKKARRTKVGSKP